MLLLVNLCLFALQMIFHIIHVQNSQVCWRRAPVVISDKGWLGSPKEQCERRCCKTRKERCGTLEV